jgi:anti-anti-sigma factor
MSTWKLETIVEPVPGGAIVTANGRIGQVTGDRFAEALRRARREASRLIVDLTGVDYISGPGVRALLETADSVETLILCGLGQAVRNTLDLAGVNGRVRIEETRAAAIEKVGAGRAGL